MSKPKRHHYIPKNHILRFYDENNQVHYFDKNSPDKGVERRNKDSIFYKRHHNSIYLADGTKDTSIETRLSQVENYFKDFVDQVSAAIHDEKRPVIPDELRNWFISYVSNQATRALDVEDCMLAPETRKEMISVIQQVNRENGVEPSEGYAAEIFLSDNSNEWLHNAGVLARYEPKHQVEGMLKASHLQFACAESGCQFVLGSMPVLAGALPGNEQFSLMALPLTPTIIAIFGDRQIPTGYCSQESVRRFNLKIVDQSKSFCSGSRDLTKSLIPKSMR